VLDWAVTAEDGGEVLNPPGKCEFELGDLVGKSDVESFLVCFKFDCDIEVERADEVSAIPLWFERMVLVIFLDLTPPLVWSISFALQIING